METPIDLERCKKALQNIRVEGSCGKAPLRLEAIAEAIEAILTDGKEALSKHYIGVKQYAGFGDQGSNHPYGYGPTHGGIVFSIERTQRDSSTILGKDEVYYLECERDYKRFVTPKRNNETETLNLCETIGLLKSLETKAEKLREHLKVQTVDAHELTNQGA